MIRFLKTKQIKRTWGLEKILTDTDKYLGKINFYKAGFAGGLQYHTEKDETFHILSGEGWLDYDIGSGNRELIRIKIYPGDTIHIPPLTVHRIEAITDLTGIEFSTVHFEDRVRVEERYGVEVIGEKGLPSTW